MKKIYYLDKVVVFGTQADFELSDHALYDYKITDSAEQTKIEFFSDSTKPVALISNDYELEFSRFISNFDTIEAGGGVVRNEAGDTLMIFRNGRWDLPKGKLEKGEKIEDCALREVEEECNVTRLTLKDFRAHTFHIYKLDEKFVLKKTWWWNMSHSGSEELTPQTEEGITEVKWVNNEEMTQCLKNTYLTIRDLLKK